MTIRTCPACAAERGVAVCSLEATWLGPLSRVDYCLARCLSCETLFLSPDPPADDLGTMYQDAQFASHAYRGAANVARVIQFYGSRLETLSRLREWEDPVSVLEVGAGRAWMCLAAKLVFPESRTVAQDVTAECARVTPWADRYEVAPLRQLSSEYGFHLASLTHVIEHLPDPRAELQLIRALMREDGIIFVTAPHRPIGFQLEDRAGETWRAWPYNHVPGHLQYFSKEGLARLAAAAGLMLERWDDSHEDGQAFEAWLVAV
jgi:SAM-dependent methyltransferase